MLEVDRVGRAQLLAGPTTLTFEPDARLGIENRYAWNRLRERHVDRLAISHPRFKFRVQHVARTFFDTDATAGAQVEIDLAGLLADLDFEVADRTRYLFQLGIGIEVDILVLARFRHLGSQDAGRAVEGWKRFIELRHMATDRRLPLNQMNGIAGVGQFERGLETGDAAAHHQRRRVDVHKRRLQRLLVLHPSGSRRDQRFGLLGGCRGILVHPRAVLANVGHFQQVGV